MRVKPERYLSWALDYPVFLGGGSWFFWGGIVAKAGLH